MLRAARDCGVEDTDAIKKQPLESLLQLEGDKKAPSRNNLQDNFSINNARSEMTIFTHHPAVPNLLAENIETSNLVALTGLERTENR